MTQKYRGASHTGAIYAPDDPDTNTHKHTNTGMQCYVLLRMLVYMDASCDLWSCACMVEKETGVPVLMASFYLRIHGQTAIFPADELAGLDPLEDHHATLGDPPLFPLRSKAENSFWFVCRKKAYKAKITFHTQSRWSF
jgi:hypothetical protein